MADIQTQLPVKLTDGTNTVGIAGSGNTALKVDVSATGANATAILVTGTGGTFPITGTVTAIAGSGTYTVAGTVTANQGTANTNANGWPVKVTDGTDTVGISTVSGSKALKVDVIQSASGGGIAQVDKSTFTEGTATFTPSGGVFNETPASDPTEDQAACFRITAKRALHTNLRNNTGTEIGTSTDPVRVDPTGTTTQPVSGTVTANAGSGTFTVGGTVTANAGSGTFTVSVSNTPTVTANAGSGTFTVGGTVTSNQGTANTNANGWPVKITDGTDTVGISTVSGAKALKVDVIQTVGGGSGGVAHVDKTTFTEGTATFTPAGGVFNETPASDPTEDQAACFRITAKRALHTNLRNNAGTEIGTSSDPVRVDPTGTTTQPVSGTVTANAGSGTFTVGGTVTANAGSGTFTVSVSNTPTVTANAGTGTFLVRPTDGTNPITQTFDLDTGAGTDYNIGVSLRKAASGGSVELGTSTDPVRVDPTGTTTQPVSGTVTANAGSGTFTVSVSNTPTVTANAGSGTFTVGGTVTANQGTANTNANGWPVKITDGTDTVGISTVSGAKALKVDVVQTVGGSGGVAHVDKTTFTEGTATFTPSGGVFNETPASDPTEDQAACFRITAKRALHTNLRNNAGTEIGTSTDPVRVDPTGTTTQPVSGTVTANAGSGTFTVGGTVTANAGSGTFTVSVSNTPTVTANAGSGTFTVIQAAGSQILIAETTTGIVHKYGTVAAVASGSTGTVSYTVGSGKTLYLKTTQGTSSGGPGKVQVQYGNGTPTVVATSFYASSVPQIQVDFRQPIAIADPNVVEVTVLNNSGNAQDIYAFINGHEI